MKERTERIGGSSAVKGTLVQAHLEWAQEQAPDLLDRVGQRLEGECRDALLRGVLATDWIPLRCLVEIDRAVADVTGADPEAAFEAMGRHSAERNLRGVYKDFVADEPHRFFEKMSFLHRRFMNFGRSSYEKTGPRSGRVTLDEYPEYSPVICASGRGYYEAALDMMKVPGPVRVVEETCICAGDPACRFELSW